MSRAGLIVAAFAALALASVWWVASALLTSSHESACVDAPSADFAFAAAHAGIALAVAAFVAGVARAVRTGWVLLAIYAALFVSSLAAHATCS